MTTLPPASVRGARSAGLALALAALTALAAPARGDQVVLGVEQAVTGQSNLFRSTVREISDGSYQVTPSVKVLGEESTFRYLVEYDPSYEVYFISENVNGLDHFFRGQLAWDPLPVSTLRLRADVADYRSVRGITADGPAGIPDVVPQVTGDITRSFVDLDYEHALSRTTVARAAIGMQSYAYTTPNNADSLGGGGELGLLHELTRDFSLGGSLLGSYRRFDELVAQPGSENAVANANLILLWEPTPSFFVEVEAGPAVVVTRQDPPGPEVVGRYSGADTVFGPVVALFDTTSPAACTLLNGQPLLSTCPVQLVPGFPGSFAEQVVVDYDPGTAPRRSDEEVYTAFADIELRKEDHWGFASVGYFRREDASAGIGTTTVRDSVTLTIQSTPFWQVDLRVRGNWNRRVATGATDRFAVRAGPSTILAPGGTPVAEANGLIDTGIRVETEITQYWADLLVTREVFERTWLELGFRYLNQQRIERPGATTEFDDLVGSLMVRYEFAPIEF